VGISCEFAGHLRAVLCLLQLLGTEFLPEMDEGGFILDYFTPPGSSLAESNRILLHIEEILHATPEVENTSRRTGCSWVSPRSPRLITATSRSS